MYKDKKVFITGHTGFKGSWLCAVLCYLGAEVTGFSLRPEIEPNLFGLAGIEKDVKSVYGDIRDLKALNQVVNDSEAEIVFHMAAQPLVRESYVNPRSTYDVNVMGTVNLLEAVRNCASVRSVVNVTTDKVYQNTEHRGGYVEDDRLDGYDPYANSKSCSELITASYRRSFFFEQVQTERKVAISTARAGNVIGGGDFAKDRIIPDCARTALGMNSNKNIIIRNPNSIRPYQHVLEPLFAYLQIAIRQYQDISYSGAYNIGPKEEDCITTKELVEMFCKEWQDGLSWEVQQDETENQQKHEANFLKLNSRKVRETLGYEPRWNIKKAIEKTAEWYKCYSQNGDNRQCMEKQIKDFIQDNHKEKI